MAHASPGQAVLDAIRKKAKQAMKEQDSEYHSSMVSALASTSSFLYLSCCIDFLSGGV